MHTKRNTSQRIIEAVHALTPKDNDALLRYLVQRLERMAALVDELDDQIDELNQGILVQAVRMLTGAGIAGLVIKADSLSSSLKQFASALRHNELRRKLPPEGCGERR